MPWHEVQLASSWCEQGRGLSANDVEVTARKLRLYRLLRQVDPSGFIAICSGSNTPRIFVTEVSRHMCNRYEGVQRLQLLW